MKNQLKIVAIVLSALLLLAGSSEAKHSRQKVKPPSPPPAAPADSEPGAKTVQYGEKDVVKLKAKVGFTTLIVLPEKEVVLDYVCGDKEFWVVNGNQNVAYVKPAREGSMTNLNLVTEAGNIYTFVLVGMSKNPDSQPDLKVFVEPKEKSMISAIDQGPRFVSSREIDNYRQQLELAKEETLHTKETDQWRRMPRWESSFQRFDFPTTSIAIRSHFRYPKFGTTPSLRISRPHRMKHRRFMRSETGIDRILSTSHSTTGFLLRKR